MDKIDSGKLLPFIRYKTSRSGGSGGQHVNKVESKVTLLFDIDSATVFTDVEKARIRARLKRRLQADGCIQISSQVTRSQLENKAIALARLVELLHAAQQTAKPRKATKPSKAAVRARLDAKHRQALRKISRRKDWE